MCGGDGGGDGGGGGADFGGNPADFGYGGYAGGPSDFGGGGSGGVGIGDRDPVAGTVAGPGPAISTGNPADIPGAISPGEAVAQGLSAGGISPENAAALAAMSPQDAQDLLSTPSEAVDFMTGVSTEGLEGFTGQPSEFDIGFDPGKGGKGLIAGLRAGGLPGGVVGGLLSGLIGGSSFSLGDNQTLGGEFGLSPEQSGDILGIGDFEGSQFGTGGAGQPPNYYQADDRDVGILGGAPSGATATVNRGGGEGVDVGEALAGGPATSFSGGTAVPITQGALRGGPGGLASGILAPVRGDRPSLIRQTVGGLLTPGSNQPQQALNKFTKSLF